MEGPRPVKTEEFDSLMEMINDVFTSQRRMMHEGFPLLFNYGNCENLFVFVDGSRVVSHVGILIRDIFVHGCRLKTASVGSVGTYEEYRGRGFAGACLAAAEKKAVAEGASVTIISGRRSLYTRFGALQVGRALRVEAQAGKVPDDLEVSKAGLADAVVLSRLYEREPVRFHRPLEDWRATMEALEVRSGGNNRHGIFIVSEGGEPAAYAVCSRHERDSGPHTGVAEYAGCRRALVRSMPAMARELGSDSIEFKAPDYDPAFRRAASAAGLSGNTEHLAGHTVKVSSVENLFRGLRPLSEERVGRGGAGALKCGMAEDGRYEVFVGEERSSFDPAAFTALAFGQPEGVELDSTSAASGVLEQIFPIPLPLPGLNYV